LQVEAEANERDNLDNHVIDIIRNKFQKIRKSIYF
jgi:hypothetical protein